MRDEIPDFVGYKLSEMNSGKREKRRGRCDTFEKVRWFGPVWTERCRRNRKRRGFHTWLPRTRERNEKISRSLWSGSSKRNHARGNSREAPFNYVEDALLLASVGSSTGPRTPWAWYSFLFFFFGSRAWYSMVKQMHFHFYICQRFRFRVGCTAPCGKFLRPRVFEKTTPPRVRGGKGVGHFGPFRQIGLIRASGWGSTHPDQVINQVG